MNITKFIKVFTITAIIALGAISFASAQETSTFNVSLSYGSTNKAEVLKLQNFLFNLGYLKVAPTGLFLSLTRKAVSDFQAAEGVSPTLGYFGPLTRTVANSKLATGIGQTSAALATISNVSVTQTNSLAGAAVLASSKTVTWQTNNFPTGSGVDINLIRKTSDSPKTYNLIRTVVKNSPNDGKEVWTLQNGEISNDVYLEVVCSTAYQLNSGCKQLEAPAKVN